MKKSALSVLSVFLCIAIIFGTQGFTIGKMLCLSSGKVSLSFSEPVDCCAKKEAPVNVIKKKCCDLKSTNFKLSSFHSGLIKDLSYTVIPEPVRIVETLFHTEIFSGTAELSKAPPLAGRDRLILASILLI